MSTSNPQSNERPEDVPTSLAQFADSLTVDDQATAVTDLNKTKVIFTAFDSDEFRRGIARLEAAAENAADERSRIKAISTLERLRAVLKKNGRSIEQFLRRVLQEPLPSMQLLESGDERIYLANALTYASGDWLMEYAAAETVAEVGAEKARASVAKALFRGAGSADRAFAALAAAIVRMPVEAGKVGNAVGKRMRRILVAARSALGSSNIPLGTELPAALKLLLRKTFERSGPPEELNVAREVTAEVAGLLDDLVRLHLSLLVDSEMYGVLNVCRRWFPLSSWSTTATKATALKTLAATITEGVALSAKQGITDQKLFESLELALGSKEKALQITRSIADQIGGLPEGVQTWLRQGHVSSISQQTDFATQSAQLRADQYVATALIEVSRVDGLLSHRSDHQGQSASSLAALPDDIRTGLTAINIAIRNLADARGLALFGEIGRETNYSPNQHEVISGVSDSRKVKVLRYGVERTDEVGNRQPLVKALVEPSTKQ